MTVRRDRLAREPSPLPGREVDTPDREPLPGTTGTGRGFPLCQPFMISEPLLGWRAVQVTQRRTAKDLAEVLRWLVEDVHSDAEKVVVVMDNLNTHKQASLYE